MSAVPSSSQGSRFGHLSRNQFFARHNPHPNRVRHMSGLWGQPICTVNDDPLSQPNVQSHAMANVLFPPQNFSDFKVTLGTMPVGLGNMGGPQRTLPTDTISALQYFTGLRSFSFKEKAVPHFGMLPVTDTWRQELRSLTETIVEPFMDQKSRQEQESKEEPRLQHPAEWLNKGPGGVAGPQNGTPYPKSADSRRTPLYSPSTGRLIPPSSRMLQSRRAKTQASLRDAQFSQRSEKSGVSRDGLPAYDHISLAPDMEAQVFTMLCGILQTEDVHAVQAWLSSASEREKSLVTSIIQTALCNREEYSYINPEGDIKDVPHTASNKPDGVKLPPILEGEMANVIGASDEANRITIHGDDEVSNCEEIPDTVRPITSAAFDTLNENKNQKSECTMTKPVASSRPPIQSNPRKFTPIPPIKASRGEEVTHTHRETTRSVNRLQVDSAASDTLTSSLATPLLGGNGTWNPNNSVVQGAA